MKVIQSKLDKFKRYCLKSGDQECRAWCFSGGPPSPIVQGTVPFGSEHSPLSIYLIDLYHGRTLTLVNNRTLRTGGDVQIALKPVVILDSNAISYIDRFFSGSVDAPERDVIANFVRFAKSRGMDFSSVFYSIESLSRSSESSWYDYAFSFHKTHFHLQVLDLDLLVEDGRFASSIEAKDLEVDSHDATGVDDLVNKYTLSINRETALSESANVKKSFASLLKASLLGQSDCDEKEKYRRLTEFMIDQLGQVLGLERTFALFHWLAPENYAALLPVVQRGVNVEKFFRKVSSTAWDFYLGRLPEKFGRYSSELASSEKAEATCNLLYIATAEAKLAEVLSQRSIELLIQHTDQSKSDPLIGQKMNLLAKHCESESQFQDILDFVRGYESEVRASRRGRQENNVPPKSADQVVSYLKSEVRKVCRPIQS